MIAKQGKGKDFFNVLKYNQGKVEKGYGVVLETNLTSEKVVMQTKEFNVVRQLRPNLSKAVYHTSLSLPYSDSLSDKEFTDLGRDYLKDMGFDDNQFIIYKHTDQDHSHIHIVANRVKFSGDVVSDSHDYKRSEALVRKLELKYNLTLLKESKELDFTVDNIELNKLGTGNFVAEVIGGGQLYSDVLFPLNNWTFICVTLDTDNTLSIYEDNVLRSSMQVSIMPQNIIRTLNYIGKSNWDFDAYTDGQIDDVRIYNRALSLSEIDELYNEPNPATAGIQVEDEDQTFTIYPNPAQNSISLSDLTLGAEIGILDLSGKVIFNTKVYSNQLTINTDDFTNGLYLIHLNQSGTTSTKKLIVNK